MANRKTNKDLFIELRDLATEFGTNEQVEFINKRIELLNNKNNKPNANQIANQEFKANILLTLKTLDRAVRISELQDASTDLKDLSNQRISALLKQLVDEKAVERIVEKRIAKFKAI